MSPLIPELTSELGADFPICKGVGRFTTREGSYEPGPKASTEGSVAANPYGMCAGTGTVAVPEPPRTEWPSLGERLRQLRRRTVTK